MKKPIIDVIIPAFNEEKSIIHVLNDLPEDWVREVIVCNNASTDGTAEVAAACGATVVHQPLKGYGNACLKGMEWIAQKAVKPDIVVFLDGDYSDHPEELPSLVAPIWWGNPAAARTTESLSRHVGRGHFVRKVHEADPKAPIDMVIGSRAIGVRERGAMTPQQVFGNWLATRLMRLFFGYTFTDLGPFRAIRYDSLLKIGMVDRNFGWTVEMQVKAAKQKMVCVEIPVTYRRRIGVSKVSGTVKGTIMAGYKILLTIFRYI